MGALPKALARRGHRVMAIVPRYKNYDDAWETGVRRAFRVFNQDVEVSTRRWRWLVDHVATIAKEGVVLPGLHCCYACWLHEVKWRCGTEHQG